MARSIVHEHLESIVYTESNRFRPGATVRLLDAGCGSGALLAFLRTRLPELRPHLRFEFYGFDVSDYGAQREGEPPPGVTWISINEPWPYPDGFFQIIISNHVLEHVSTPAIFFRETHRTLAADGFSAHLFPTRECIWEPHINIPFAHWFKNRDLLRSYIAAASCLGIGTFSRHSAALDLTREEFARQHADFLLFFTRYMTSGEVLGHARESRLAASFRYTPHLYMRKLRRMLRLSSEQEYRRRFPAVASWAATALLRYVSGVTLFLEKDNSYGHGTEQRVQAALSARGELARAGEAR